MKLFKNRQIDYTKPGLLYRNLNRKERTYSFEQGGLVRAHLTVGDTFWAAGQKVLPGGLRRYQETEVRCVHAFLIAELRPDPIILPEEGRPFGYIVYDMAGKFEWKHPDGSLWETNYPHIIRITEKGLEIVHA